MLGLITDIMGVIIYTMKEITDITGLTLDHLGLLATEILQIILDKFLAIIVIL